MENTMMNMDPVLVAAFFFTLFGMMAVALWALRSGRMTSEMMETGTAMLEGVSEAAGALAKATGSPAVSVASFILKAAGQAAHAAEQMHKTGEIAAEERNAKAKEIAEELLTLAGIEVTQDRKAAIAVLLEAECDMMGHMIPIEDTVVAQVEDALQIDEASVQEMECEAMEQPEIGEAVEAGGE